jgi:hypothetical protein
MRREVPVIITFIVGTIMLLSNFITVPMGSYSLARLAQEMGTWVIIISAFAVGLASVNLVRIHGRNLSSAKTRFNSGLLLCALCVFAVVGIVQFYASDSVFWTDLNQNMYNSVLSPLSAAMFALIAFYLGSAAYRVFRMRSFDATVLLIACAFMMLGQAPVGALIWNKFPTVSGWLLSVPNNVGQRAIMMGAAIGAFATSLRILFGIERGHFGAD